MRHWNRFVIAVAVVLLVMIITPCVQSELEKDVFVQGGSKWTAYDVPLAGADLKLNVKKGTAPPILSSQVRIEDTSDTTVWTSVSKAPDLHIYRILGVKPGHEWVAIDGECGATGTGNGDGSTMHFEVGVLNVESLLPDNIEREVDDGDGNPDTRTFVVNMTINAGALVTVTAKSDPNIAKADLPNCWLLEVMEGTANGADKLVRVIDRTRASKTVLCCSCGNQKITTVYVVRCTYSGFSDNTGVVGHGWWHLGIEPSSAVQGVLEKISPPYTWMINTAGGFFPIHQGQMHDDGWINIVGQGHTATAHHDWLIPFHGLINGVTDLSTWVRTPGTYDFNTRNCVWGSIRIGNASGVAMPAFNYILPPVPPFSGFWHPWHLHDWLKAQP